jgi:hypothetical protein
MVTDEISIYSYQRAPSSNFVLKIFKIRRRRRRRRRRQKPKKTPTTKRKLSTQRYGKN